MWSIEQKLSIKIAVIELEDIKVTDNKAGYERLRERAAKYRTEYSNINIGDIQSYNISQLDQVSIVLQKQLNQVEMIKALYAITNDFKVAKTFYYNFNYIKYIKDRKSGLIK